MQEAEEQDTCRICSAPGEPEQPLFYPCKCSGTIRYIHQDCLTTWLAHSKKKTCDVCKHPYSFTKVYAADMPSRLPPVLLIRRLAQQCLFALIFALRAVVVGIVWLAVLPWATVWTWRMYFTMGDSTAWWISDRPRSSPPKTGHTLFPHSQNTSAAIANGTSPLPSNTTFVEWTMSRPFWRAISADIFAGQIIATLIVLTFIAIFLLREWISQNARPGVFEDEEFFAENRDLPPQEPAPQPAAQPQPAAPPNGAPIAPAPDPGPVILPHTNRGDRIAAHGRGARRARRHHVDNRPYQGADSAFRRRRDKGKGKARDDDESATESDVDPRSSRIRRRLHSASDGSSDESEEDQRFPHNLRDVVAAAAMRRAEEARAARGSPAPSNMEELDAFEFTFRAPAQLSQNRRSFSEPCSSPGVWSSEVNPLSGSAGASPISASLERGESTELTLSPSSSSDTLSSTASPQSGIPSLSPSVAENLFALKSAAPASPVRRPPMPSTTLPTPNGTGASTPPLATDPTRSGARTPLASPSLATYRAPEELGAGPSTLAGYFDREDLTEEELRIEQDMYFRAPEDEAGPSQIGDVSGPQQTSDSGNGDEGNDYDDEDEEDEDYEHVLADDEEDEEDEDENADDVDALDFNEDADWDDEDDQEEEEGEGEGELRQVDAGVQQQLAPGPPAPEAADVNEDLEGNVEDDMEGAMEAIGMRGPIYGVVQNAALMVFVLDTAIGLGVWLPFTIGKSTALLSLDPHRFLQIIHLPIRAMRIITDPIVDSIAFLIKRFALPPILRFFYMAVDCAVSSVLYLVAQIAGQATADRAYEHLTSVSSEPTNSSFTKVLQWISPSDVRTVDAPIPYSINALFDIDSSIIRSTEPHFAALGKEVRVTAVRLKTMWIRLALGDGTTEKIFAVILGYAVVALLLAMYLNILTVGNVKSAGRAVRNVIRQQLLVLKVAVFIIIELVMFPLGCGIMLDVCSVWLFPEASFQSRVVFFVQSPVTAMFYHWVAGTMFMYQFAILLAGCRGIMRAGAMWFIKDPQDQNFHPIRDILERPTFTQLRKLLISAIMYSIVVALGVGSVASLLFAGFNSILPLRWKTREPLSDVPIDLLFLHFVLPYTMHYFRPKKVVFNVVVHAWKQLARHLRLTSYMFGDRYPMEEFTPQHPSWTSFIMTVVGIHDPRNIHDGSFRRVPASDNVALPREMRATAEVDANGKPATEAAAKLIQMQNAEAEKAKRTPESDYTVVYIPPHFRYRIILFIFALWVAFAICVAISLSVPILLGRSFFKLFTPRDVHDGYSFITGFYLLWGCYIIGKAVDRMDKRRQRRGSDGPRAEFSVFLAKRSLLWLAKISYMLFFLGLVIPILISLVMDFYIIMPIRLAVNPALKPHVRIVDAWALGLLYAKIAVHVHRLQRPTLVMRGLNNIANNGWTHPDPWKATKEIIGPVTGGLALLLLFPAAIVWGLRQTLSLPIDGKFIFMHVYPGLFAVVGFGRSIMAGMALLSTWSQSIRDKEFLVEMRLRNHEPVEEEKKAAKVAKEANGELSDN